MVELPCSDLSVASLFHGKLAVDGVSNSARRTPKEEGGINQEKNKERGRGLDRVLGEWRNCFGASAPQLHGELAGPTNGASCCKWAGWSKEDQGP